METAERIAIGSMGELLVEFVCDDKDGHHRRPSRYLGPFPSGAPAIFIDQAARLGARAIFAGAVGDDGFGQVLLDRLRSVGVSDRLVRTVTGVPTGSAFVAYNSDGSREFVFNIAQSAAARLPNMDDIVAALLDFGIAVFHISGSTLGNVAMCANALSVCRALRASGVAIAFDPNIRKELLGDPGYLAAVTALVGMACYVLPSEEDAAVLFAGETFSDYAPRLLAAGAEYVVLKLGADGCMGMSRQGEILSLPAHRVAVLDPTGAGDCFCATFVTLMASGQYSFGGALERANGAGALAVGKVGPMEGNSDLVAIDRFLAKAR